MRPAVSVRGALSYVDIDSAYDSPSTNADPALFTESLKEDCDFTSLFNDSSFQDDLSLYNDSFGAGATPLPDNEQTNGFTFDGLVDFDDVNADQSTYTPPSSVEDDDTNDHNDGLQQYQKTLAKYNENYSNEKTFSRHTTPA